MRRSKPQRDCVAKALGAAAMFWYFADSSALADEPVCGAPPSLSSVANSAESIKGQLQGQADFLSKLVGRAELAGQVEAARNNIYQTSDSFLAAQKEAYLAYMFCVIVMQDKTLSTQDKLQAINQFRVQTPPDPVAPKAETTVLSDWQADGTEFQRHYRVKIVNGGNVSEVKITVYGDNLVSLAIEGNGDMSLGAGEQGPGWISKEIFTPNSIRGLTVRAKKPGMLPRLDYSFE